LLLLVLLWKCLGLCHADLGVQALGWSRKVRGSRLDVLCREKVTGQTLLQGSCCCNRSGTATPDRTNELLRVRLCSCYITSYECAVSQALQCSAHHGNIASRSTVDSRSSHVDRPYRICRAPFEG
jgi:hypothetical protein